MNLRVVMYLYLLYGLKQMSPNELTKEVSMKMRIPSSEISHEHTKDNTLLLIT